MPSVSDGSMHSWKIIGIFGAGKWRQPRKQLVFTVGKWIKKTQFPSKWQQYEKFPSLTAWTTRQNFVVVKKSIRRHQDRRMRSVVVGQFCQHVRVGESGATPALVHRIGHEAFKQRESCWKYIIECAKKAHKTKSNQVQIERQPRIAQWVPAASSHRTTQSVHCQRTR